MKYTSIIALVALLFVSCDKHDMLDDNLIVGQMAPQVYWSVQSTTVTGGSEVPYKVQYYTTAPEEITHGEVWYEVFEIMEKEVTCPWVTTFKYSMVSNVKERKRIDEKINTFAHDTAWWNDSISAFTTTQTFPVSYTMRSTKWVNPSQFDQTKMDTYFGTEYQKEFVDSLYTMMQYADFEKMFSGLTLVENFKADYADSTFNENSQSYDYHFPKDADGKTPTPEAVKTMYFNIPFKDIIFNSSTNEYFVSYKRSYSINASVRIYDAKGVYGQSLKTEITIN